MALQGVITPSIAGVFGVRDYSQQLANANAGVRNLANFALNQMGNAIQRNAQANEAAKQREFQAGESELQRKWQDERDAAQKKFTAEQNELNRNLEQSRWENQQQMQAAAQAQAAQEKLDNYHDYYDTLRGRSLNVNENNPDDIRRYQKELTEGIVKARRMGDEEGAKTLELENDSWNGVLQKAEKHKEQTTKIEKALSSGSWRAAQNLLNTSNLTDEEKLMYTDMIKSVRLGNAVKQTGQVNTLNQNQASASINSMLPN